MKATLKLLLLAAATLTGTSFALPVDQASDSGYERPSEPIPHHYQALTQNFLDNNGNEFGDLLNGSCKPTPALVPIYEHGIPHLLFHKPCVPGTCACLGKFGCWKYDDQTEPVCQCGPYGPFSC